LERLLEYQWIGVHGRDRLCTPGDGGQDILPPWLEGASTLAPALN
jgi:hypothetical protein